MAKGHANNAGYRPGDHWAECDRCGFDRRVSALSQEWNGLWVCKDSCFETRHPQDSLRVRGDVITAREPVRPGSTSNTVSVTFADSFTVPSGTFNNEL